MKENTKQTKLILFDGVCNLCNSSVLFVIKRDKKSQFMFAPLQSEIAKYLIEEHNIDTVKMDSIILYIPEKELLYYKSTAALKIAASLGLPINLLSVFLILPAFIRNIVYDFISKNRYKWYGKKDQCMIPTPELQSRFII